jgi:hypothetical protein
MCTLYSCYRKRDKRNKPGLFLIVTCEPAVSELEFNRAGFCITILRNVYSTNTVTNTTSKIALITDKIQLAMQVVSKQDRINLE